MVAREPSGCSTGRGAEAEATAATAPPARECVRRVWSKLVKMTELADKQERMRYANMLPNDEYFREGAGREHYALLEWLGNQWPGKRLIDLGTYRGASALALIASGRSTVVSVDVTNAVSMLFDAPGITRLQGRVGDWLASDPEVIPEAPLVVLDISHNGSDETEVLAHLERIGFKGIVVADDIHLNNHMRNWWAQVKQPKADITRIGHHSGTGIVLFE